MKIVANFNVVALDYTKKPLLPSNATLAEFLGEAILAKSPTAPPMKAMLWCYALGEKRPIEGDEADFRILREVVETSQAWAILRGQIIQIIDDAKDAAEKT